MLRQTLALACLLLWSHGGVLHAQTLTVATGHYPPYTDRDAADGGAVNARVAALAERAGLSAEFSFLPWKRALEQARSGTYQTTSFWYHDPAREADFFHIGPLMTDRVVFFKRLGTEVGEWTTLSDLAGFRIGAVRGYTYTPAFWAHADAGTLDIQPAQDDESNLRKLLAGRIDLYPMSARSGWHLINTAFDAEDRAAFATVGRPLSETDGFLLVSRHADGAADIAARLTDALGQFEAGD